MKLKTPENACKILLRSNSTQIRECASSRQNLVCFAAKHRDLEEVPYPNATMLNISKCPYWKPTPFSFQWIAQGASKPLPAPWQDCIALSQQKLPETLKLLTEFNVMEEAAGKIL